MATTITLKNIPTEIYDCLKRAAEAHRRSINSEAIACLERVLMSSKLGIDERASRAKRLRANLAPRKFKAADIAKAINRGRS